MCFNFLSMRARTTLSKIVKNKKRTEIMKKKEKIKE